MAIAETQIRLSNWKIHVQKQVDAFKILIFWYQYQYFEILISILILILLFGRYWSWYWYWHQEKYWSWYWSWFFGRETIDIDIDIEIFIWKNIDLDIDPKFDIVPPLQAWYIYQNAKTWQRALGPKIWPRVQTTLYVIACIQAKPYTPINILWGCVRKLQFFN